MLINRNKGREYGIFRYAVLFSELEGRLKGLMDQYPGNMRVDVMGHSSEGRELFLVTLANDVSDEFIGRYSAQRLELLENPQKAIDGLETSECPALPVLINCNLHGTEISGTDGMLTFIDEVLGSAEKSRYLDDCVILISICLNPDGRSRGLDILNGRGVDLNRDWMAQTQPEVRALISGCLRKFYPTILVDMHGYMSSANILIDACTPPHNPLVEYDLLEPHILGNSKEMARAIKERTNLDSDIPALIWKDGWEDYSPVYTPGYFMCNGAVTHTIELNFPSEDGAYVSHAAAIGMLDYVHAHRQELYQNQCLFYLRGVQNVNSSSDYYIIADDKKYVTYKTVNQLLFNGIRVYINNDGDYAVPLAQPLRPLIHNMLWQGEDISDLIDNCYDVSFYSYPVMRGLQVSMADQNGLQAQNLMELSEPVDEKLPAIITKARPRILAVTESGYIDELMEAHGYNCHFIPYSELNTGYRIDASQYDIMIIGGSQTLLWEDAFDEQLGVGYHNSWGLRERGRREVLHAAEQCDKLVLFGYAGMKVNDTLNRIRVDMAGHAAKGQADDSNTSTYMLNVSNGSFKMLMDPADPLCAGYGANELFYFVAPLSFKQTDGKAAIRFDQDCFVNGFNKNKGEMDGQIAALHKTDGRLKTVLLGFDPAYRGYTDVSFNVLLNAVSFVSS